MRLLRLGILLCLLTILSAVILPASAQELTIDWEKSTPINDFSTESITEWAELFYRLTESESIDAPAASRLYAYAGITIYETLYPGMAWNNSLAGQISHMPDMPFINESGAYDWISTFNAGFSTVTRGLFAGRSEETITAIEALRTEQMTKRIAEVGEETVGRSMRFGDTLGKALLRWIANDNFAAASSRVYTPPIGEGFWEFTGESMQAVGAYWGTLRPFAIPDASTCAIWPDVPYSTDPNSTFYLQAVEVMETERNLTEEQQEIARYWLDAPGQTGAPAGHWFSIGTQMVKHLELTVERSAQMYAMLGMTLGDSFISAWWMKYQINLLRPVTYIRANIRRSWSPYIESPPFPEYPSGHSVTSAAAAEVLTQLFGAQAFTDETHIIYGHEPLVRSFLSFDHAGNEAAISRLYGGIHFRSAIENGIDLGRCLGDYAMSNIRLNPVTQGE